ncbi:hypothetical protein N7535_008343 [Penicillium sp. DV-2018c]|nr:hypothetical protein N7461_002100 [Penicillium sp. DV-2018c]KAJ5563179.1 hypothetical protein N7535_008343 [Penicillium sp. DV-2018c]
MVEKQRLEYISHPDPQVRLRADTYAALAHRAQLAAERNIPASELGRAIILPSSHEGRPRQRINAYRDSLAIMQQFGKPTLFITFAANPHWAEIKRELFQTADSSLLQDSFDRPDLIARVFHMKLKELLDDIEKRHIFGPHLATVYVVEFQKRGLPHAHILSWLQYTTRFSDPQWIDQIVCAELPDPDEDPEFFNIVKANMMHGRCGHLNPNAFCMQGYNGRRCCSQRFPKPYVDSTTIPEDGFPLYRRRQGPSFTEPHPTKHGETISVGNEWIVSYCPFLCRKFKAHINVEFCTSIHAIRYLHKYIYKGADRATVQFTLDETKDLVNGRYIGSSEAMWRLMEFPIDRISPPVMPLVVHLENQQTITFDETIGDNELQQDFPVTSSGAEMSGTNVTLPPSKLVVFIQFLSSPVKRTIFVNF